MSATDGRTSTITDPERPTAADLGTATVTGIVITPEEVNQGSAPGFIGEVATFTDSSAGTNTYTASVNFGDGVWRPAEVASCGSGVFSVVADDDSLTEGSYDPSVSIESSSGMTSSSIMPADPNALGIPSTPSFVVDSSTTAVTLSWTNVNTDGATSIEIEEEDFSNPGSNYYLVRTLTDPTSTSTVITGLTATYGYSFTVRYLAPGESSYSAPITVWMRVTAPTISNASSGSTYTLDLTVPSDGASGAYIYYQEVSTTLVGDAGWNTLTYESYSGLTAGAVIPVAITSFQYNGDSMYGGQEFNFRAMDYFGLDANSKQILSNPSSVVAIADTTGSQPDAVSMSGQRDSANYCLDLDIDFPAYPDPNAGYRFTVIQNGVVDGQCDFSPSDYGYPLESGFGAWQYSLPFDDLSNLFLDAGGGAGSFKLELNAIDSSGNLSAATMISISGAAPSYSPPPNLAVTSPATPTGLSAASVGNTVRLEWDNNSNNESGYDILESTDGGATYTQIGTTTGDATTFVAPAPSKNKLWTGPAYGPKYKVVGLGSNGAANSAPSAPVAEPPEYQIYLLRGDDSTGSASGIVNTFHESVGVGTNGHIDEAFSFGEDGNHLAFWYKTTWLGWSVFTGPSYGAPEGKIDYMYGDVNAYSTIVETKDVTALEASDWKKWMESSRVGTLDVYSIPSEDCRVYSQWEFADAPGFHPQGS